MVGINRTDRVFASVLGDYHGNFRSQTFNQASATGTFGYAHGFANHDSPSLSGQVQQFWLGDHRSGWWPMRQPQPPKAEPCVRCTVAGSLPLPSMAPTATAPPLPRGP